MIKKLRQVFCQHEWCWSGTFYNTERAQRVYRCPRCEARMDISEPLTSEDRRQMRRIDEETKDEHKHEPIREQEEENE